MAPRVNSRPRWDPQTPPVSDLTSVRWYRWRRFASGGPCLRLTLIALNQLMIALISVADNSTFTKLTLHSLSFFQLLQIKTNKTHFLINGGWGLGQSVGVIHALEPCWCLVLGARCYRLSKFSEFWEKWRSGDTPSFEKNWHLGDAPSFDKNWHLGDTPSSG